MIKITKKKVRQLNVATHRDLGYFFVALVVIYCISGLALNHIDDWNPDFIIKKQDVALNKTYTREEVDNKDAITAFGKLVGEDNYKVFDFPTHDQVKIYYDNASLHLHLHDGTGVYEQVKRRPLVYESNVLHRNSLKGWKWASDIFAVLLIVISITGLFVLKGKHGIKGRGKWLVGAGLIPPIVAILIHALT